MLFSRIPKVDFAGYPAKQLREQPDNPEIVALQQVSVRHPITVAKVAVDLAARKRPVHSFSEASRNDAQFKNGHTPQAADRVARVMSRIIQPDPQHGNRVGKRFN